MLKMCYALIFNLSFLFGLSAQEDFSIPPLLDINLKNFEEVGPMPSQYPGVNLETKVSSSTTTPKRSETEQLDDLFEIHLKQSAPEIVNAPAEVDRARTRPQIQEPVIFDLGDAEKELLNIAHLLETQISSEEWKELVSEAQVTQYTVQEGDWLWKISQRFFGSGFYYPKIWSLNPQITNPHEIEPGMVLVFDTGTIDQMPTVSLGEFRREEERDSFARIFGQDLEEFSDSNIPSWLIERERLRADGAFFQFASAVTYEDLKLLSQRILEDEYQLYEPPAANIIIQEPGAQYDETGFDRSSVVEFRYRDGYFLTTFVTNNIVQDLGHIKATPGESIFLQKFDTVYLDIDRTFPVKPGDRLSVYSPQGKVSHPISDREGYRYSIVAQIEIVRKIDNVWEAQVSDISGLVQRGDRLTLFTPSLNRIAKTFSRRTIEAAIIGSYRPTTTGISLGDVVYLDRGRLDGVEQGNIFELFGFIDRGTGRRITNQPTYTIGEVVVLTATDNFSTALVLNSSSEIPLGTLAMTKTADAVARAARLSDPKKLQEAQRIERDALDNLDIELNLDQLARDLLRRAESIQLTDDEFDELERRERERSVIDQHERDLRELERLEREISEAEAALREARVDEDLFLEQKSLEMIERGLLTPDANAFEGLDEIEREIGLLFMDEDLNAKDNPYGLTEFDIEEIDLLLNSEQ